MTATGTDSTEARPRLDERLVATARDLCQPGALQAVVQPIVRPADMTVVGYEALARMPVEPHRPPNWWLEVAGAIGLRHDLEVACFRAVAALGDPPGAAALFVNASPSTVADPDVVKLRDDLPDHLVIELTEQEAVDDYGLLRTALARWLARGVRIAVDDAGAGYSSLRHVVELSPDYLKLDRELVRDIDQDGNRRALMRAVVAFAREIGTSVIAEGIETEAELEVLREAEVHLAQGYLLARPGPPWPPIGRRSGGGTPGVPKASGAVTDAGGGKVRGAGDSAPLSEDRVAGLRRRLASVGNVLHACELVVEDLFRQEHLMSSLYLQRGKELRCVAHRGLWQVLDGMPGTSGVTGRAWSTGHPVVVEDVSSHPDYLEAVPGVVAEICVPVIVGGGAVGSLNAESTVAISPDTVAVVDAAGRLLAERLEVIGTGIGNSRWQRAAVASAAISGLTASRRLPLQVLHRVREAADMDSACLVVDEVTLGPRAVTAVGPLEGSLRALTPGELGALWRLVGDIRSCYTAGDASGTGFVGTESLRAAGARAVVVLPLWARRHRFGTLVLAHSRPIRLTGDRIEPLELLADHVAAVLAPTMPPAWPA